MRPAVTKHLLWAIAGARDTALGTDRAPASLEPAYQEKEGAGLGTCTPFREPEVHRPGHGAGELLAWVLGGGLPEEAAFMQR